MLNLNCQENMQVFASDRQLDTWIEAKKRGVVSKTNNTEFEILGDALGRSSGSHS